MHTYIIAPSLALLRNLIWGPIAPSQKNEDKKKEE
jgi:hypothetical protein